MLSYNTKDLLRESLLALEGKITYKTDEIIIVDNASNDESVAMIKKEFPRVRLIRSDTNLGFAKGINLGAEAAEGEYVLFLNSDAKIMTDTLPAMVSYMDEHKKCAVLGGLLKNYDGSLQRSFGQFYTVAGVIKMLIGGDKAEMPKKIALDPFLTDWVSGGFMMVKKDVFQQTKRFDENFFMYIEDMELCYRLKHLGYNVAVFPQSFAIHAQQGSSNRSFAVQQIYKGLLYFYKKHRSWPEYFLVKFLLVLKAKMLMTIGSITKNTYLTATYRKALQF